MSAPRPAPPAGCASWLDYVIDPCLVPMVGEVAHARAELAELRHRCISTDAQLAETHRQLDQATSELAELRKELETTMGLLEQQTKNTMEALAQRDEARVLAAQGRAAGRSEAAQILMERFEPELFDADGNGKGLLETYQCGEETATRWVPEKVREMFDVPPLGGAMGSRLERCENAYWEIVGELDGTKEERDSLRAQVAELRGAVLDLGELVGVWDDARMDYVEVQVDKPVLSAWNALVARLRAEAPAQGKEEQ